MYFFISFLNQFHKYQTLIWLTFLDIEKGGIVEGGADFCKSVENVMKNSVGIRNIEC